MLIDGDGVMSAFDTELLESRIARCFVGVGIRESWVAEDIALAVEFALAQSSRREKIFSVSEVNSAVTRILENTGFPDAAAVYRVGNVCSRIMLERKQDILEQLIHKHLGLTGAHLSAIAANVANAAQKLKIDQASPALYIELAKHLESEFLNQAEVPAPATRKLDKYSPWLISADEIGNSLKPPERELLDAGIFRLSGISRLFPAVKIVFRINELARFHQLLPPLTEMMLTPCLYVAGDALRCWIETAGKLYRESCRDEPLPVYLNVPDMASFARQKLDMRWPDAEKECREMLTPLYADLTNPLFKLKLS